MDMRAMGPISGIPQKNENILMAEMKKQAEHVRKLPMTASLETKLKTGVRLNDQELDFLKRNNPDLYEKALKMEGAAFEGKMSKVFIEV